MHSNVVFKLAAPAVWLLTRIRRGCTGRKYLAIDLAFLLVFFIAQVRHPMFIATTELDFSWSQAFGEFLRTGAQAGVDYVFTYGPLGYFNVYLTYEPSLYWHAFAWFLGMGAFVTCVTVLTARRMPTLSVRLLFYFLTLIYACYFLEVMHKFVIVEVGLLAYLNRPRQGFVWLAVPFLAALSLEKFTYLLMAGVTMAFLSAGNFLESRKRTAFAPLGAFLAAVVLLWVGLGQQLSHLPVYLHNSIDIFQGYTAAMGLESVDSTLGCSVLVLILYAWLCGLLCLRRPWQPYRALFALLTLLMVFMQWKHAYVRDDSHVAHFWLYMVAAPLVVLAAEPALLSISGVRWLLGVVIVLSMDFSQVILNCAMNCGSLTFASNCKLHCVHWYLQVRDVANHLADPWFHRDCLEIGHRELAKQWELSNIRARVGNQTTDIFSYEQGVLLLNGFRWSPRPIFQGYSAYTDHLIRLNAEHFRGPRAPEYVLFNLTAIDNRFPAHEDSGALLEVLRRYRPVLKERQFLLMERQPDPLEPECEVPMRTVQRTIHLGEQVRIPTKPGQYHTLALRMPLTDFGKLWQAAYRPPVVRLNVVLTDGERRTFRLIPNIAGNEFLLSPALLNTDNFADLYGVKEGRRVASFSVTADNDTKVLNSHVYSRDIEATLRSYSLAPLTARYSGK